MWTSATRAGLLGLALLGLTSSTEGQPRPRPRARVVERVVALVDGRPIWLSELRAALAPHAKTAATPELRKQVLDRLVDRQVVLREAARAKIGASQAEVDAAIDHVAKTNAVAREELFAAARAQGYTEASYRAEVALQLVEGKLLQLWMVSRPLEKPRGGERELEQALARHAERWRRELRKSAHVEVRLRP